MEDSLPVRGGSHFERLVFVEKVPSIQGVCKGWLQFCNRPTVERPPSNRGPSSFPPELRAVVPIEVFTAPGWTEAGSPAIPVTTV